MIWTPPSELTSEQIVSICDLFLTQVFNQTDHPDEYAEILSIKTQHQ